MRSVHTLAFLALWASVAAGQQPEGPTRGTWGVEASSRFGGSLLRFRSTSSAWVLQLTATFAHLTQESPPGVFANDEANRGGAAIRVGLRSFRRTATAARPFATVSLLTSYDESYQTRAWTFGAAGEMGAAYFFSPHVSLGGAAELAIEHSRYNTTLNNGTIRQRWWGVAFNGVRLLGTVYF